MKNGAGGAKFKSNQDSEIVFVFTKKPAVAAAAAGK